jgi:DNA-binding NarL/FixJ family response regulator
VRLVIADDHELFAYALRAALVEQGIDVAGIAGDGEEAVRLTTELRPDVLVLDLNMPRASGFDVMKALQEQRSETRVVVLTGADQAGDRGRAADFGAIAFLQKSQPMDEIAESIRLVGALAAIPE